MAITGGPGNDILTGTAGNDTYEYGSVAYAADSTTVITANGFDTIVDSGGYDTLVFANLSINHIYGYRSGNDFVLTIQPTTTWPDPPTVAPVGGVTLQDFYVSGGASMLERINFSDAYVLFSLNGEVLQVQVFDLFGTLVENNYLGTPGNDTIVGTALADFINGEGGNDTLSGLGGNDELDGGDGDDNLQGGDGADQLLGGAGNDFLVGGMGLDFINGGNGSDVALFEDGTQGVSINLTLASNQVLNDGFGYVETIVSVENLHGSSHNDTIRLGNTGGYVFARSGNDTLIGGGGNDLFFAGSGIDSVDGMGGNNTVSYQDDGFDSAGAGIQGVIVNLATGSGTDNWGATDTLTNIRNVTGSSLNDTLTGSNSTGSNTGNNSNNTLTGNAGADILSGGEGNDTLYGGNGPSGVDVAGDGADTLYGGNGNDTLRGNAGDDFLYGGDGDDNLRGDGGDDLHDGGNGIDLVSFRFDEITGLSAGVEFDASSIGGAVTDLYINDGLGGYDHLVSIERVGLSGTTFGDTLTGSQGSDQITGNDGDDTINGGLGSDSFLSGGNGNDSVSGGDGDDVLDGGAGTDTLAGGAGTDRVEFNLTQFTTAINFDGSVTGVQGSVQVNDGFGTVDTLIDIEAIAVYGGSGNDTLVGGMGHDILDGGAGNDNLYGGAGGDTLIGGAGNDYLDGGVVLDPINLDDRNVANYSSSLAAINVNLQSGAVADGFGGTDTLINISFITGSNLNDTMLGSTRLEFEQFDGGGGDDVIDGGAITDLVNVINANRVHYGGAGGSVTVDLDTTLTGGLNEGAVSRSTGGGGNDTLYNINVVRGSNGFGDFLYGSNRSDVFEAFEGLGGNDTIDGRGGFDYVRYDNEASAVTVNLFLGTGGGTSAGSDLLFNIEGARGSAHNDTLIGGNAANNALEAFRGQGGNDFIDGGSGFDRAEYNNSRAGVVVTLGLGVADGTAADGYGSTDTLRSIEAVRGSSYNDSITGNEQANTLDGADGHDFLFGRAGADTLNGDAGFDTLNGGSGNDALNGGDGGDGEFDKVDYFDDGQDSAGISTIGVTVNLASQTATDNWGNTDTLVSIEGASGSAYGDTLLGNSLRNDLFGNAGNDTLSGADGRDYLFGGAGTDTLNGDAGFDTLNGGSGDDTLNGGDGEFDKVDYFDDGQDSAGVATMGVTVNLALQTAVDNWGNTDTLSSIEGASGSAYADTLLGNSLRNDLLGNAGNDTLSGADGHDSLFGGAGADTLNGDAGFDTLNGGSGNDALNGGDGESDKADYFDDGQDSAGISTIGVTVNLASQTATDNWGNTDTLTSIEGASGSAYADILLGNSLRNDLFGNAGNDTLIGADGHDFLFGGAGADTLNGDAGFDTLNGGSGDDTLNGGDGEFDKADYSDDGQDSAGPSTNGITVNLELQTATDNWGNTDTLNSIEGASGSAYGDTLLGNSLRNDLLGNAGNDTLDGADGHDYLFGGAGADTLNGDAGFDTLNGGSGNDALNGGDGEFDKADYSDDGQDSAGVSTNGVTVNLASQTATDNWGGTDTLNSIEGASGSAYGDTLLGNSLRNDLFGNAGNDTLSGADGNDFLFGGDGGDYLSGGSGSDTIDGGDNGPAEMDTASYRWSGPAVGVTVTMTGAGTGTVMQAGDFDTLLNVEAVEGSAYADSFIGSDANDMFTGDEGNDTIAGGGGNDFLNGHIDNDTVDGGTGNDWLIGGLGNDTLTGGDGVDTADYWEANGSVVVSLAAGTASGAQGNDTLSGIENVNGGNFNDTLTGDGNDNSLWGQGGNDALSGGGGRDFLTGGAGIDTLDGGDGNDTAFFENASVGVVINLQTGNVGNDGFGSAETIVNVENLHGSYHADNITMGNGGGYVFGRAGADTLTGGSGNDNLIGGSGADILDGGAGISDNADYYGGDYDGSPPAVLQGVIVNLSTNSATDNWGHTDTLYNIENISGSALVDSITGDAANNNLGGNDGNDLLYGLGGTDWLRGDAGNDTLDGGDDNDTLVGGLGNDALRGGAGLDNADYGNAAGSVFVTLAGAGTGSATGAEGTDTLDSIENIGGSNYADTLTGDANSNTINGQGGNDNLAGLGERDYIFGGDGADTLDGGDGNDQLRGDAGADTLLGGANNDYLTGGDGNDALHGDDGIDTADYFFTNQTGGITVTLLAGAGTATGNEGTDTLTGIENINGTSFSDWIVGDANANLLQGQGSNDYLEGGGGNDTLDGGNGIDTADYSAAAGAVEVNISGTQINTGLFGQDPLDNDLPATPLAANSARGADGNDTLINIENIEGSSHDDILVGNTVANLLQGGLGNDTLAGRQGSDTLYGGGGVDTLYGDAGDDILDGGSGNDILYGGAGGDTLIGGAGNDLLDGGMVLDPFIGSDTNTASYAAAVSGVSVNLALGAASNDGDGGNDTLVNIASVIGSAGNDTLIGASGTPWLEIFTGGLGNDFIDGGAITDALNGVDGNRAAFNTVNAAVTVDLAAGTATGQGNDTLININQAVGSSQNDFIYGSNRTDITESFRGLTGADLIDGRGGFDIARYENFNTSVIATLNAGTVNGQIFGTSNDGDTLYNIEGLRGGSGNDTLSGGNPNNDVLETFMGNGGNDTIDGASGYDRVEYHLSPTGVTVTLGGAGSGTASDGQGGTDTLLNIEGVRGSSFNDTLNGSDIGSLETFEGREGNDTIDGEGGEDRAVYSNSTSGVSVVLGLSNGDGTAADGYGTTDTLRSIEDVRGSSFGDTITGNELNNMLEGQDGDDSLVGGDGNDTIDGGDGNDTLSYDGTATLSGGAGSDSFALSVAAIEAGNPAATVTDFQVGAGGDLIDLADAIARLHALGMAGSDPFAAGWMQLRNAGADTQVEVDLSGNANGAQWVALATLQGVAANTVGAQNFAQVLTPVVAAPLVDLVGQAEIHVNTTTSFNQSSSAIAALAAGGYVVTWTSDQQDGSGTGIYAQGYDASGAPAGTETRVNTWTAGFQGETAITALADGGYVISWTSNQDATPAYPSGFDYSYGVYAQRYSANGATVGTEVHVNTTIFSLQFMPAIAALENGGFVISWTSAYQDGGYWGVYAQRYDANGATSGGETRINTTTAVSQQVNAVTGFPAITGLADGGYVVTWDFLQPNLSGSSIFAQRYSAGGVALGSETLIATSTITQTMPAVTALTDGGYVVTWITAHTGGPGYAIQAQHYSAGGAAVGGPTVVNSTAAQHSSNGIHAPAVTSLADGGYVVTWQSAQQDGSGYGTYAQRFGADDSRLGGETLVNVTTIGDQWVPSIAGLADGGFAVTWTSNDLNAGSSNEVYVREFRPQPTNADPTVAIPIADQATDEDAAFAFIVPAGTFNDPDAGDTLTYTASRADDSPLPAWLSFNPLTQTFSGTPLNGDVGSIAVKVTATDRDGATASDKFALAVANTNDAPEGAATAVLGAGTEDMAYTIYATALLQGFSDPDLGDQLAVSALVTDSGGLLDNLDGTWTFTPGLNFNGSVALTYAVVDGDGASVAASQSFTVAAVNDAPVAGNEAISIPRFTPVSIDVLANDSDIDSSTLTVTALTQPDNGSVAIDAATGRVVYTPPTTSWSGATEFTYTVSDGNGGSAIGTVAVTVNPVVMGTEGSDLLIGSSADDTMHGLGGNDTMIGGGGNDVLIGGAGTDSMSGDDGDDVFEYSSTVDGLYDSVDGGSGTDRLTLVGSGADNGGFFVTDFSSIEVLEYATTNGAWVTFAASSFGADGLSPSLAVLGNGNANILGVEAAQSAIVFSAAGFSFSNWSSSSFYITGSNGGADTITGSSYADTLIGQAGNDTLDGGDGNDTLLGGAGNDTLIGNGGDDTIAYGGNDTVSFSGTATITGGAGRDTIVLSLAALQGGSAAATVTDFTPGALGDRLDLSGVLATLGLAATADPFASGHLRLLSQNGSTQVQVDPSGSANGGQWLTLAHLQGTLASALNGSNFVQSVVPVVAIANNAPVVAAAPADQGATEDSAFDFSLADVFSDADAGDTLVYSATTLDDGSPLPSWLVLDTSTGAFSGTPLNSDVGAITVRATATDTAGASAFVDFAITVSNVNDAPIGTASAALASSTEDTAAYTIDAADLLQGFSDPDLGDVLSVSGLGADSGNLVDNGDDSWTFTPAADFNGTVSLNYTVDDGNGGSVAATQSFDLVAVNDAPVAPPSVAAVTEGGVLDGAVNGSDVDSASLTYALTSATPAGLSFNADGTYAFDAALAAYNAMGAGVTQDLVVGYSVSDGDFTADSTLTITVTGSNDGPTAAADIAPTTPRNTAVTFTVLGNDSDPDTGDVLSVLSVVPPASGGVVTINATTGQLTYTPAGNWTGTESFDYTLSDGHGGTATASVTVTVTSDIFGTPGNDTLPGTAAADTIYGYAGNDTIDAKGGDDTVWGGDGNDSILGGSGNDTVHGEAGNDTITGGSGVDRLYGGDGDDVFNVSGTDLLEDTFDGGAGGNDRMVLTGNVTLTSMAAFTGIEALDTGGRLLTVAGSNAIDLSALVGTSTAVVQGDSGANDITTGSGWDTLFGSGGADKMNGGAGDDTFAVAGGDLTGDILTGGGGNDTLQFTANVTLTGAFTATGIEVLVMGGRTLTVATGDTVDLSAMSLLNGGLIQGDSGANTITGTQGGDTLNGQQGTDVLNGGLGNDTLYGGTGADVLRGGLGNDVLYGGSSKKGDSSSDTFVFDTAPNGSTNRDTIVGFEGNGFDKIALDQALFSAIGTALEGTEFRANAGGTALDGDDFILYDTNTGTLYYDSDGSGGTARVAFAVIDRASLIGTLDASDFQVGTPPLGP